MPAEVVSLLLLATQPGGEPATAPEAEPPACELHVWGAVKTFPAKSRFAAVAARKGTYHADRSNSVANINALDPAIRIRGVSDDAFAGFFGEGVPVRVIRHSENLDLKAAKKVRKPLSERNAQCHGDLIVSELGDIEWPNGAPDPSTIGILEGALMAPAGMNLKVTFLRFDSAGSLLNRKRAGANGALRIKRAQWPFDPSATVRVLDLSVEEAIRAFGAKHLGIETRKSGDASSE